MTYRKFIQNQATIQPHPKSGILAREKISLLLTGELIETVGDLSELQMAARELNRAYENYYGELYITVLLQDIYE